jgi:hypothetical protein
MTDKTPMDAIHDGVVTVSNCAYSIRSIATALERVGMSDLALEMFEIAASLKTASEEIRAGHARDLTDQVRRSQAAVGGTLAALLDAARAT